MNKQFAKSAHPCSIGLILSLMLCILSCTKQVPVAIDERNLAREKVLPVILNSGEEQVARKPRLEAGCWIGAAWTAVNKSGKKK